MTRAHHDDPERMRRPSIEEQTAGLGLFEPPPRDTRRAALDEALERNRRELTRKRIVEAIRQRGPLTADEVSGVLGIDRLYGRPRVSELVKSGVLVDSGIRRLNSGGRHANAWRVANG